MTSTKRISLTPSTRTTAPLPSSLRADITSALLSTPQALPRIQDALLHELQSCNWTSNLRTYVLDLLRSGECSTYDEVMARVMAEARADAERYRNGLTMNGSRIGGEDGRGGGKGGMANGNGGGVGKNGVANGNGNGNGNGKDARVEGQEGLRIPERAIREGIRAVRKELEGICKFVDEDDDD